MQILQRVEEVRAEEHARLRQQLQQAAAVLQELREDQEQALVRPARVDMFGDPVARPGPAEAQSTPNRPRYELGPMVRSWSKLEDALLDRVDSWEMDLWPTVQRWAFGEPMTEAVRAAAARMVERRRRLEPLLREVRLHASVLRPMRPAAVALFSAIEQADAVEADIVASLAVGRTEVVPSLEGQTPTSVGSHVVSSSLRAPAADPRSSSRASRRPRGLMQKLTGWLTER